MSAYRIPNTRTIHESSADKNMTANSSGRSVVGVVSRTLDVPRLIVAVARDFFPLPKRQYQIWGPLRMWEEAWVSEIAFNTLRTGDADLRFYITTVQDGWHKSAFLTRACFPCTIHLIMQYIEPVSEWSCWRMFIETCPHSELTIRPRAPSV